MGFIKLVHQEHLCSKPGSAAPGSIWLCDECDTGWRAVGSILDSRMYGHWTKMFGWTTRRAVKRANKEKGIV